MHKYLVFWAQCIWRRRCSKKTSYR